MDVLSPRLAIAAALLLAACPSREPSDATREASPDSGSGAEKIEMRHAEQLTVATHPGYKVVTVHQPWSGAREAERYLLLRRGTPRPAGYGDAQVIEIPVRTVITTSTTELPHLVELGLAERLVGHDELDWVSSPKIRQRIDAGALIEVGSGSELNVELVLAAQPDLLLADSLGDPELDTLGQLRRLGVPVVLAPSFLETSPLGRAEWIRFTALFFDREPQAAAIFAEVERRYQQLAARVRAALPADPAALPRVLTGAPLGDTWWVPGGRSFFATLLRDAGARALWHEDTSTGSLPVDLESVYDRALDADAWLHPSTFATLEEIRAADGRFAALAPFREGRIYSNDRRRNGFGGNDYWESGTARPDLVLADLVRIFHPELVPGHELVYHRRVESREAHAATTR